MTAAAVVWEGADQLREWLVPVHDLERYPGNPRRGQVSEIAKSLARFGQVRPVLTDGHRIVAGNHTYLAALELGWSHVAAVPNAFKSDDEARAYLLADNRLPELGEYDQTELTAMLEELEQSGRWDGTGYALDDLEDLRAAHDGATVMDEGGFEGTFAVDPAELARRAAQLAAGNTMKEVVLMLTGEVAPQWDADLRVLKKEYGDGGVSELVERAVAEQVSRAEGD